MRLGDLRAATTNRNNNEADIDALCRQHGTTTSNAFRTALTTLDLARVLYAGSMTEPDRTTLRTRRGALRERQLG